MASGCLMGICPVCDGLIWEDEWDIVDDTIIHADCRHGYIKNKHGMNENQFLRLCGAAALRKEIREAREYLDSTTEFYREKLKMLEERMDEIEKGEREDMSEIKAAIDYFEIAIREAIEIIPECSEDLHRELTEQNRYFQIAIDALREKQVRTTCTGCRHDGFSKSGNYLGGKINPCAGCRRNPFTPDGYEKGERHDSVL